MDYLQIQHLRDIVEQNQKVLFDLLSEDAEIKPSLEEARDRVDELQEELDGANSEVSDLESKVDDYERTARESASKLSDFLLELERDYPGYDTSDLQDIITDLESI